VNDRPALEIVESAWSARRAAFDLPVVEQRAALAAVREELERAADMLRNTNQTGHYAHALHLSAHVAMDVGDLEAAETGWREAVELLRGSGEPLQLAHKVRHLGDLEMSRANLEEAGRHYAEALALYREHSGAAGLDYANLVRKLGILAEKRGDAVRARAWWSEARELYAKLGVAEGVTEADERLEALAG